MVWFNYDILVTYLPKFSEDRSGETYNEKGTPALAETAKLP